MLKYNIWRERSDLEWVCAWMNDMLLLGTATTPLWELYKDCSSFHKRWIMIPENLRKESDRVGIWEMILKTRLKSESEIGNQVVLVTEVTISFICEVYCAFDETNVILWKLCFLVILLAIFIWGLVHSWISMVLCIYASVLTKMEVPASV